MASSASLVGKIYKACMTAEQPFKHFDEPGSPGFAHRLEIQQLSCLWQGRRVPVEDVADFLVGVAAHCEASRDEIGLQVATHELEYMSRAMQRGYFARGTDLARHEGSDPLASLWSTLSWSFRPSTRGSPARLLPGPLREPKDYTDDFACAFEVAMSTLLRSWLAAHSWRPTHSSNSVVSVDTPYFQRELRYRRMALEIGHPMLENGPNNCAELHPGPFYGCTASFSVPRWNWWCWSFIDSNDPLEHLLHLAAIPTLSVEIFTRSALVGGWAAPRRLPSCDVADWQRMEIPGLDPATPTGGYLGLEIPPLVQEAVRRQMPWMIVPHGLRDRPDVWDVYFYDKPLDYWSGK
jgi:hypothetical protein